MLAGRAGRAGFGMLFVRELFVRELFVRTQVDR